MGEPVIEEAYDENVAIGQVISQSIEAGQEVDEGTVITLKISLGVESFEMPDVKNASYTEAEKLLTSRGLNVNIEYQKDDDVQIDNVISQSIASGTSVKRGDTVTIIVSSGKKTVSVSNVTGMAQDEAISALEKQGFKVAVLENYDNSVAAGRVISQSPDSGTSQIKGSTITIYVSKGKQPITVTFNSNGGSAVQDSKTVYYGESYGTLPSVTRAGYVSDGWYTESSGGTKITESTEVICSSNHTLYVHWTPATYTLTLNANGGSLSTSSIKVKYQNAYGTLPTPTRDNYIFDGWHTEASGGTKVSSDTKMGAGNTTIYAHWTPVTYTLTLNANGGSLSTSSIKVKYQSAYGTLPTPTRDYYTFKGWYTEASGGTQVSANTKMGAGNTTLYAHWTENSTSGWVRESDLVNLLDDIKIVAEKWTYTERTYKESQNKTESGWILYDSKRTSWGTEYTSKTYSDPGERNYWTSLEQVISGYTHIYKYYHRRGWGYNTSTGEYGYVYGTDSSLTKGERHTIELTYPLTVSSSNFGGLGVASYKGYTCEKDNQAYCWLYDGEYDKANYSTITIYHYQDPIYTYYFYKDSNGEDDEDPTKLGDTVSNVVKYVKYISK